MDLGVTMLTGLGGGHFNNLTRSTLDNDMTVLSQSRTLHGESLRSSSIGSLEGVFVVVFGHATHQSLVSLTPNKKNLIDLLERYKVDVEKKKKKAKKPRDETSPFYTLGH